jgi:hypothetical protein
MFKLCYLQVSRAPKLCSAPLQRAKTTFNGISLNDKIMENKPLERIKDTALQETVETQFYDFSYILKTEYNSVPRRKQLTPNRTGTR